MSAMTLTAAVAHLDRCTYADGDDVCGEAIRAVREHARATNPAAGGDLAALRGWLEQQREDITDRRRGAFADVVDEIDRRLAAAPAFEAATEGEWRSDVALIQNLHVATGPHCVVCDGDSAAEQPGCTHRPRWCTKCERSEWPCFTREAVDRLAATPRADTDPPTAAWAQHLDDTAEMAGGFTEPERDGIRAAARMLRDPNVRAQVAKTVGGES